ncbi:hypothetical protein ABFX02_14G006866 [Erythranthe guttata]
MNSSYGKSNNKSASTNAFDFDLGLGSGRSKPMNDPKSQASSYTYSSTPQQKPNTTPSWSHQPKPAWTHQPAAPVQSGVAGSLSGPTSMVGDIFGKSWNSSASSSSSVSGVGIGIVNNKNPNLFGDLLTSSIGQSKSANNAPLKKTAPLSSQNNTFSMGNVADSLPKTGSNASNFGANVNLGGNYTKNSSLGSGNLGGNGNRNQNLGGPSLKNKDPFVSLVDFSSNKTPIGMNSASAKNGSDNSFGDFQSNTSKTSGHFPKSNANPLGDFVFPSSNQSQPSKQPPTANDFDVLFNSTAGGGGGGTKGTGGFTSQQQFSEGDDWGMNSEFVGDHDKGGTTEIEGLPPPPAGVSAPSAKSKGMDNYKQGQFADAIKWLSWAVILLEKAGDEDGTTEALTCRASCYKEVGEYKKAVADCTKVLESDGKNVSVLVQRALLYESMEKYKLGAEDLRTVMKFDPGNRVARSTIHRLTKMAG